MLDSIGERSARFAIPAEQADEVRLTDAEAGGEVAGLEGTGQPEMAEAAQGKVRRVAGLKSRRIGRRE